MSLLDTLLRGRRRPRPASPQTIISRKIGKAIGALILAGGAALFGLNKSKDITKKQTTTLTQEAATSVSATDENYKIIQAIAQKKEMHFVEIKNAKVIKLLRNDNKGARHQRWIVQLSNGDTITAIYNIDLSEKIPLETGGLVDMAGELVFGDRKNYPILHWIHADPQKKRMDGYVMYNGKKYGLLNQ